jgi:hypothetical protein
MPHTDHVRSTAPAMVVACPCCTQPLRRISVAPTPLAEDFEDVTEACFECGTELIRTVSARTRQVAAA